MTPEAQQIAIAEACGWQVWHQENNIWLGESPAGEEHLPIPDYLNDLNAMHEAEKVLNEKQCDNYRNDLDRLCLSNHKTAVEDRVWHAAAAQRAEAFLKCLGLWIDDACPQSEVSTTANP